MTVYICVVRYQDHVYFTPEIKYLYLEDLDKVHEYRVFDTYEQAEAFCTEVQDDIDATTTNVWSE